MSVDIEMLEYIWSEHVEYTYNNAFAREQKKKNKPQQNFNKAMDGEDEIHRYPTAMKYGVLIVSAFRIFICYVIMWTLFCLTQRYHGDKKEWIWMATANTISNAKKSCWQLNISRKSIVKLFSPYFHCPFTLSGSFDSSFLFFARFAHPIPL